MKQTSEDAGILKEQDPEPPIETNEFSPQMDSDFDKTLALVQDNLDQDGLKDKQSSDTLKEDKSKADEEKSKLTVKIIPLWTKDAKFGTDMSMRFEIDFE